jgi:hypothetical protein
MNHRLKISDKDKQASLLYQSISEEADKHFSKSAAVIILIF